MLLNTMALPVQGCVRLALLLLLFLEGFLFQQYTLQPLTCHRNMTSSCPNPTFKDTVAASLFMKQQQRLPKHFCKKKITMPVFEKEPQIWQPVQERSVIVFSAFYESRNLAGGPAIRIIANGLQAEFNEIGTMHCMLYYDHTEQVVDTSVVYDRIYPSNGHYDMWVSHFILCKLPADMEGYIPYAVSVVPKKCMKTPGNHLMVLDRNPVKIPSGHALCLSPLYNNFRNATMLIEMFEIHKILGAGKITIYLLSGSHETRQVLESYDKDIDENVEVVNWPFPQDIKSNVFGQRGALNDCLYRNMALYKYVTITDLDEILVPRMVDTWPQLLSRIGAKEYGAYLFQHAYFRREYTDSQNPLITQTSFYRTDKVVPPGKIRCKTMYNATQALKIDLHFAYELLSGAQEYMLEPEEGMLHHYRSYPMETFRKHPERFSYIRDTFLTKFGPALRNAYDKRLHKVNLT